MLIIFRWILLRMRNFSDKNCRKNRNICSVTVFRKSCRLWDNVGRYGTARQAIDDNIIRRRRIGCWITSATAKRSEFVILNIFPRQQWVRERVPMLRYTYMAWLLSSTQQNPALPVQASIWVISPQTERPKCGADCTRSVRLRVTTFVHKGQLNTSLSSTHQRGHQAGRLLLHLLAESDFEI